MMMMSYAVRCSPVAYPYPPAYSGWPKVNNQHGVSLQKNKTKVNNKDDNIQHKKGTTLHVP